MAYEDVTAGYVDLVSYNQYSAQTADEAAFDAVKQLMSVYLNTDTQCLPDRKYTHALALLVCHYYALGELQNPGGGDGDGDGDNSGGDLTELRGPITKEKVGDIEIEYADITNRDRTTTNQNGNDFEMHAWLRKTIYGLQYLRLMKSFGNRPIVI